MNTLATKLRGVLSRHAGTATPDEIITFANAISELGTSEPVAARTMPRFGLMERFSRLGSDGQPTTDDWVAVYDAQQDLTFLATPLENTCNWKDAQKAAADCRLLGRSDWRLPTVCELVSIIDYGRFDPAVDTQFFKGPYGYAWTSQADAESPSGGAWGVYLHGGGVGRGYRGGRFCVRAVRAGQTFRLSGI